MNELNKKKKNKIIKPPYHSYHGNVHIPLINKKLHISLGQNIIMNSGCPNHVVVNVPDQEEIDNNKLDNNKEEG